MTDAEILKVMREAWEREARANPVGQYPIVGLHAVLAALRDAGYQHVGKDEVVVKRDSITDSHAPNCTCGYCA